MALFGLGTTELIVIVAVVVVLFGASVIPKLARSMGRAKGEFVKAKGEFDREAARTAASGPKPGMDAQMATDDQVRETARSLGIDPAGKDTAELKRLIQQKLA